MGLLIDSSVLIQIEKSGEGPADLLDRYEGEIVALAAISASELLHGVHRADSAVRRARRESFIEAVLVAATVLPFDLFVARTHARVWADLSRRGKKIGGNDLQIAATALEHRLPLATLNAREFERVDGLELLLPVSKS